MSHQFKPYRPDQALLLPPSLHDWLPEGRLVYFLSDVVDQLDLSSIIASYAGDRGGQPPYHPAMMVKLLLYAYCLGPPHRARSRSGPTPISPSASWPPDTTQTTTPSRPPAGGTSRPSPPCSSRSWRPAARPGWSSSAPWR